MKSVLISLTLIVVGIVAPLLVFSIGDFSEQFLSSLQIPENSSKIAGIQKYNIPPISNGVIVPNVSSKSVLIKDLSTDTLLYEKNADLKLPIASTTKIMTALVANEYFKPNSILTVSKGAQIPGSTAGLLTGENLTFKSLLYAMLLNSGNDAAFAIAENYQGGVLGFVSAMNKKVQDLSLSNTHFENPAGFDNAKHFSSARDLAKITEEALKVSDLAKIFATKETEIVSMDKKYVHRLSNLNKLLTTVTGVLGIKTGKTEAAKENLVTLVSRDGHTVLLVILGSEDRFKETTQMIEWSYNNFTWSN